MEHSYFIDRISAYKDKELDDYEYQVVQEHLESCEECQKFLERLEQLDKLVEEKLEIDGEDYFENLAQKIESKIVEPVIVEPKKETKTTNIFGWKLISAVASIAFLSFIAIHQTDIWELGSPNSTKEVDILAPKEQEPEKSPQPSSMKENIPSEIQSDKIILPAKESAGAAEVEKETDRQIDLKSGMQEQQMQDESVKKNPIGRSEALDISKQEVLEEIPVTTQKTKDDNYKTTREKPSSTALSTEVKDKDKVVKKIVKDIPAENEAGSLKENENKVEKLIRMPSIVKESSNKIGLTSSLTDLEESPNEKVNINDSLNFWRNVRDSIVSDSDLESRMKSRQLYKNLDEFTFVKNEESIGDLVNACYGIASNSKDTSEVKNAIKLLQHIAGSGVYKDSLIAQEKLKLLNVRESNKE